MSKTRSTNAWRTPALGCHRVRDFYYLAVVALRWIIGVNGNLDAATPPPYNGDALDRRRAIATRKHLRTEADSHRRLFADAVHRTGAALVSPDGFLTGDGSHVTHACKMASCYLVILADPQSDAMDWPALVAFAKDDATRDPLVAAMLDDPDAYAEAMAKEAEAADAIHYEQIRLEGSPSNDLWDVLMTGNLPPLCAFGDSVPSLDDPTRRGVGVLPSDPATIARRELAKMLTDNAAVMAKDYLRRMLPDYLALVQLGCDNRHAKQSKRFGLLDRELAIANHVLPRIETAAMYLFPDAAERLVLLPPGEVPKLEDGTLDAGAIAERLVLIATLAKAEYLRLPADDVMPDPAKADKPARRKGGAPVKRDAQQRAADAKLWADFRSSGCGTYLAFADRLNRPVAEVRKRLRDAIRDASRARTAAPKNPVKGK